MTRYKGRLQLEEEWDWYWELLGPEDWKPARMDYRFVAEEIVGLGPGIRKRVKDAGLKDWDFDRAWPKAKVAVELQGGLWMQTKSGRGKGHANPLKIINDYRKLNCAQSNGWVVFQFDPDTLEENPQACVDMVLAALAERM